MTDDFPTISMAAPSTFDAVPKGSYKLLVTDVKYSPISEWADWAVERNVDRHNEKEVERQERDAKKGKSYEPKLATIDGGVAVGLYPKEEAEYIFFLRIVGGKHDGESVRPLRTGVYLNPDKAYREKSNLYKLLDATLPDVESMVESGNIDPREAIGYTFLAGLDVTEKGNNNFKSFMQAEDHGTKMDVPDFAADAMKEDAAPIPF